MMPPSPQHSRATQIQSVARPAPTPRAAGLCFRTGPLWSASVPRTVSVLMLAMYARADHPLRSERLRRALLIFGALAFMDAYLVWSGPFDHLPFGEDEHGLSDPAVLTEEFGWSVLLLVDRYLKLARACFVVLVAAYAAGLAQSSMRRPSI